MVIEGQDGLSQPAKAIGLVETTLQARSSSTGSTTPGRPDGAAAPPIPTDADPADREAAAGVISMLADMLAVVVLDDADDGARNATDPVVTVAAV